jgi:hypothetical protein
MTDLLPITQLAEDFAWLEDYDRQRSDQGAHAAGLRLAGALVRNSIGPYLGGSPSDPLHVAILGGAGAGKSTVANLLCGAPVAEANPQAGFTRHPTAYVGNNSGTSWLQQANFLAPLRQLSLAMPSNLDEDVFQVRSVHFPESADFLSHFVVWDCPDMTTWAAASYRSRLLEIAGLADIIVYVASDERYNDEVPTQYLKLVLDAGKPTIACLMKMHEANASSIIEHFRSKVLARHGHPQVPCLTIPHLSMAQLADPGRLAPHYRIPLINQITVLGQPTLDARRRAAANATRFLLRSQDRFLDPGRKDLQATHDWRKLVHSGKVEFDTRYAREYLTGEKFRHFDEALVRLLGLLDLPGAGRVLSQALWVIRTPFRVAKDLAVKALRQPEARTLPERTLLESAFAGWLDMLRKEAAHRADVHPVWAHIETGFDSDLADSAKERFNECLRDFRLGLADEVEQTARAIYEDLERNPAILNTLRGGKFTLDATAIAATVVLGGVNLADLILVPLSASVTHHLVEFMGKKYVDAQRAQARERQQALLSRHVSEPLSQWLAKWPLTGGSCYERLDLALQRVPENLRRVDAAMEQRGHATPSSSGARTW